MGDLEKMQPRPFKRIFLSNFWTVVARSAGKQNGCRFAATLLDEFFKRHGEIYPNDKGADPKADAPAHHSDEFPAGYSLAGCSPALPASASPAAAESAARPAQLWGHLFTRKN